MVVRCSPRLRRCSSATRSAHRRLCPSVQQVEVGHSEPPVKGSRLRSLEPLRPRRMQAPTQNQEAPPSTSKGRVAPSAVGWGSSLPGIQPVSPRRCGDALLTLVGSAPRVFAGSQYCPRCGPDSRRWWRRLSANSTRTAPARIVALTMGPFGPPFSRFVGRNGVADVG